MILIMKLRLEAAVFILMGKSRGLLRTAGRRAI